MKKLFIGTCSPSVNRANYITQHGVADIYIKLGESFSKFQGKGTSVSPTVTE